MSTVGFLGAIRKRPDRTFAQFADHWLRLHRALMLRLATAGYLTGYVQNLRLEEAVDGLDCNLDGAPELWIRDAAALEAMYASPIFREALEVDTPRFVALPPAAAQVSRATLVGRATPDHGPAAIKLMIFLGHSADGANRSLQRAWHESSSPLLMPAARPAQLTRLTATTGGGPPAPYFGCESSWWPDRESLAAAWAARLTPGETSRYDIGKLWLLPAREHVALTPPD